MSKSQIIQSTYFRTEQFYNVAQRAGDLRSSFCELAHQDVFRKSHDVAPLGGIMGCNPRHDGPPLGGPSVKCMASCGVN